MEAEGKEAAASMMTINEAAEYLSLHPLTVRRLAREGKIPAFKVGRQWRVKRELLDRFIEQASMQVLEALAEE